MSRPKGLPKTGGRKVGSPRYKNGMPVKELLDKLNCNPIQGMAELAHDPKIAPALRGQMLAQLARYVAPALSTTTIAGDQDNPLKVQAQLTVEVTRREVLPVVPEESH